MLGKMMHQPLLISNLIEHASRYHASTEIVSVETAGGEETLTWGDVAQNARKLASVLTRMGLAPETRCGTIAWNNRRHLEIYFGVSGGGFVTHTINPRLHPDQMTYIINDANDRVLFIDATFLPAIASLRDKLTTVTHFVLLGPRNEEAAAQLDGLLFYDEFIEGGDAGFAWPELNEGQASSLCYTSGTTGDPKGVLYSHRSTLLHTLGGNQPDGLALSASDTVLPVVPMFHVNAWGVPYITAAVGSKLVLPGPGLDGNSLVDLIDRHQVTMALGVPTIWMGLLEALEKTGSQAASLKRTVVGGSALPPSMIPAFQDKYDVELIHAWGMTETSPLGTINQLLQKHQSLSTSEKAKLRLGQGRPPFGVELRIVDEEGNILPNDGETQGDLQIKGAWIVDTYFQKSNNSLTPDGWFDTGDVATLDADGYMIIRDRSKDIIKSGGEWISTVELENIAIGHPAIANAAAIAARHPKWDERPVLIAVKSGEVSEDELRSFYDGKVASWQIPDKVIFVDELPLGATGKVVKARLRGAFQDILMNDVIAESSAPAPKVTANSDYGAYEDDLKALDAAKTNWARKSIPERIKLLKDVKHNLMEVAQAWVEAAGAAKGIPKGSPLIGEEWISGPYPVMSACNGLIGTLSKMKKKKFINSLPKRELPTGQTAVGIVPHSTWDRLLISGVKAEVWMQEGVDKSNLKQSAAVAYDVPVEERVGKVSLVLGAGNIAAIAPLDAFQKLFLENQVVLLKMNPVNDYLTEHLQAALKPLIDCDALRVVRGDGDVGAHLVEHPLVEEIHITGARATHDAIVWGTGEEGQKNQAANTPKNSRHITSELGAVCPTIVVPGPWSGADLRFQAENIATMKLHNSGFNCVAVQNLILPAGWKKNERLMQNVQKVMAKHTQRAAYYPGAENRMAEFEESANVVSHFARGDDTPACVVADLDAGCTPEMFQEEVFAPAMGVKKIDAPDAETYLREAIAWCNDNLYGTLGGNIIIHPATINSIGRKKFDAILAEFRYGTIAINAWTGLAFLVTACPWGGFAGATLQNVQSGIGTVHNSFMLENVERTVIEAPFRPFPRNLLSLGFTLLPRPPWFVSNTQQHHVGKLLTKFQHKPGWLKLPRIFFHALLG